MLYSDSLNPVAKRRKVDTCFSGVQDNGLRPSLAASLSTVAANAANGSQDVTIKKILVSDMQSTSIGVVAAGMKKLVKVYGEPSYSQRKQIGSSEALMILLFAMSKWDDTEKVQEYGCALLQGVLHDLEDDATGILVDRGEIMDTLVKAMKRFEDSLLLVRYACVALSNLFSGSERTLADCASRFVRFSGGLETVLRVMKKHPKDATVQKGALDLLDNLFAYPLCGIPIRVSGAITRVAIAIDRHQNSKDIQTAGRDVMKCFFP